MAHYLLGSEAQAQDSDKKDGGQQGARPPGRVTGWLMKIHDGFDRRFERGREHYRDGLVWALAHRGFTAALFCAFFALSFLLVAGVGRDFFPYVDSGQMRLHVRAPAGLRLEETEQLFAAVEAEIRRRVPASELDTIVDNIGLPSNGLNLAYGDTATLGANDGDILIALKKKHGPTQQHQRALRAALRQAFPDETFFFQAANITNQILNFGLQSPIDVQVLGRAREANLKIARDILAEIQRIPGAVDVHLGQQRGCADRGRGRRSRQGAAGRPDAARRRQQHADLARLQRPGGAHAVAQPEQRRELPGGGADPAVPHRLVRRAAPDAAHRRGLDADHAAATARQPRDAAPHDLQCARRRTTTCNRCSTSSPIPTSAISAPSRRASTTSSSRRRRPCRRARRSRCAARSRRCARRSRAWRSAWSSRWSSSTC